MHNPASARDSFLASMVEVQKSRGAQPPASQQFLGLGVKLLLLLFLPELVFKLQRRGSHQNPHPAVAQAAAVRKVKDLSSAAEVASSSRWASQL